MRKAAELCKLMPKTKYSVIMGKYIPTEDDINSAIFIDAFDKFKGNTNCKVYNKNLLTVAIYTGSCRILQYLCNSPRININNSNTEGATALHFLTFNCDYRFNNTINSKMCDILLSHPSININAVDNNGNSVLAHSVLNDYAFNKLISNPNIITNTKNRYGETPLHYAVKLHSDNAIDKLISHPSIADIINNTDRCGNAPLHYLATKYKQYGRSDELHWCTNIALLNHPLTDLNLRNNGKKTALQRAMCVGNNVFIKYFVDNNLMNKQQIRHLMKKTIEQNN